MNFQPPPRIERILRAGLQKWRLIPGWWSISGYNCFWRQVVRQEHHGKAPMIDPMRTCRQFGSGRSVPPMQNKRLA